MAIRKGSKVSHSIHGGLWEVITRETPMTVFADCTRYTLRNLKTREFIMGVRDKDIITKRNPRFDQFVQLGV
jgi:hypothetical protein